ncbi:hypothetical protein [Vibrio gallicus]|uniref:hypothetical protein n=1 Tax=Vibrio gallicus TaxID=190897 RepID=UPI0021C37782|nr:hypothetical protein [Vibrio gallicus]
MKMRYWVALIPSLFMLGCSQTPTPPAKAVSNQTQAVTIDNSGPARILLKGQLVLGHEVRTIQPCGSQNSFWVDVEPQLQQSISGLTNQPYQPVYAEVFGYFKPTEVGFSEQYSAQFIVTELNMVSAENQQRCDLPAKPDRAFGNEPSWSATYNEKSLTLSSIQAQPQQFAITSLEQDLTQSRIKFKDGQLNIDKKLCSDTMSDSIYGATASLTISGKNWKGCSTQNNHTKSQVVGSYSQTQEGGTTTTLTLNQDHTSETRYSYADGSADIVEHGFWQVLHNGLLQATNVSYQGQRLIATREFTKDGQQLSTKTETINGIDYPLIGNGLTLNKK